MTFGQRYSHIVKEKTGPDDPELAELLQEALEQASPHLLAEIATELWTRRQQWVDRLHELDGDSALFPHLARLTTSSRRNAEVMAAHLSQQGLPSVASLLHGDAPVPTRIVIFANQMPGLDKRLRWELATGLLHLLDPARHWLWTRWLWDSDKRSGILPLLAGGVHHFQGLDDADAYQAVGAVTALSMRFAEGSGLLSADLMQHPQRVLFAADAFLACAYSIYLYGITSWRLSREYNRLLPTLPDMMRTLLGLSKRKDPLAAPTDRTNHGETTLWMQV
ncbi:MAG: hypothetical protein HUU23_02270 [Caldilineales bacterium]|nr:hypothetical protein [Caldilineales bacterium]